jgi:hypothetical protein
MDASSSAAANAAQAKDNDKSAEFARLYYFFDKLTRPRSHGRCASDESESHEIVPEDIAPLLKKLSAILTKDVPIDGDASELGEAQVSVPETPTTASVPTFAASASQAPPTHSTPDGASTARPRRNTVAGSHADATGTAISRGGIQARFPLKEKRYPFTFKLLLHKLYGLEDWAAKVQEVLVTSQERFRSLDTSPTTTCDASSDGDNSNSSSPRSPATFSASIFGAPPPPPLEPLSPTRRRRTQSVSKSKASIEGPRSGPATPVRPQPSRAVKKRIVNRRRSATGLGAETKGEWMYDAAVSSVDAEVVDARGYDSLRRRKRVLSSVGFGGEGERLNGHDVTNVSIGGRRHLCRLRCH